MSCDTATASEQHDIDNALRIRTIVLCALVSVLDGYDLLVAAITITSMAQEWRVAAASFGVPLAATTLGMALGAGFLASLGDRFGRRYLVIGSFLLAGLTTIVVPLVGGILELTILRFLTGLGLGASLANALALGAEVSPDRIRSRVVTAIYAISGVGGVIGGLITPWLLDLGGWQSAYLFGGGLTLAIGVILVFALPESPAFRTNAAEKRRTGRMADAGVSPAAALRNLFALPYRGPTVAIWLLFFISSFCTYLISSWLPTLMNGSGWTIAQSSRAITAWALGGVCSGLFLSWLADRGRGKLALVIAYAVTGMALITLYFAPPVLAVWFVLITMTGFATTGVIYVLPGLAAGIYPPALSATGIGSASALGKVGATVAPLTGSVMLMMGLAPTMILLLVALPVAVGILVSALFPASRLSATSPAKAAPTPVAARSEM